MRSSLLATVLMGAAFALVLAPGSALADTSLVATGAASSGYSTNIEGIPEDDPARAVEGDGFTELTPGLAAAYETRRSIHNLTYAFGARLFLTNSEANSFTNTLAYRSLFSLSERTTLRMGAGLNAGRINNFDQAANDIVGEGDVLPSGDVEFVAYNVEGALRHLLAQSWTGELSMGMVEFVPTNAIAGSSTLTIDQRARLDRTFRRHLLGVEARLVYSGQSGEQPERTLTAGPGAFWTWNMTSAFSTNSSAGIDVVGRYPNFDRGVTVPRASTALTYSHERGRATTGVSYGATSNIFGGDTTVTTTLFANLGLPVPVKRPTAVNFSAAYAVGDVIDLDLGESISETKRISGDVAVGTQLNRAWQLGLRFETSKQEFTDVDLMGLPINVVTLQTVGSVFLQGRFPEAVAAQVPVRSGDRVESSNAAFNPTASGGGARR